MIQTVAKSSKKGIMKTFIAIVFGILLLAYFGFDVRGEVDKFRVEHATEINTITEFIFETVFPASEGIYNMVQGVAEQNGVTLPDVPTVQPATTTPTSTTPSEPTDSAEQVIGAINGGNFDYGQIMKILFKFFATPQNIESLSGGVNMGSFNNSTSTNE